MTMQIKTTEVVAGVPIIQIRGFFQQVVGWRRHSFDLKWLREKLMLDEAAARTLAQELVACGYAKAPKKDEYEVTEKGRQLVRSSAAGTIKRKTAEAALNGLLKRVEQYNFDPDKILTVEAILVFGSFLGDKEELGDLDVAVKHHDRHPSGDRSEIWDAYTSRSGRTFSNIAEQLFWPSTELKQILKQRKRTIAIQDWDTFLGLAKKGGKEFQYKVVFGDPENVQAEIKHYLQKEKQSGNN